MAALGHTTHRAHHATPATMCETAHGRFKDFLGEKGLLQTWYDFEANATEVALREWAAQEALSITPYHRLA